MARKNLDPDDDGLQAAYGSLRAMHEDLQSRSSRIMSVLRRMREIIPPPEGGSPHDERTGAPMSDATRQEIYSSCIAEAHDILAEEEEEWNRRLAEWNAASRDDDEE